MKSTLIAILLAVVFVLGATVVRVENERYAFQLGFCHGIDDPRTLMAPTSIRACLNSVQTRTSWIGHIYYAVTETF